MCNKSNSKQLFKTLNTLLGHKKEKIVPKNKNNKTLTKEMAHYYVQKINVIRKKFSTGNSNNLKFEKKNNFTNFNNVNDFSKNTNIKCLTEFSLIDCEDLRKIITSMNFLFYLNKIVTFYLNK